MNRSGDWDQYSMKSFQSPHPDFIKRLDALAAVQVLACELVEGYEILEVEDVINLPETLRHDTRGVSLFYQEGEPPVMGVVITTVRQLRGSNSPMACNSPPKWSGLINEGQDEEMLLPEECVHVIKELIDEARLYLEGKRDQGDLFAEETVNEETGEVLVC